MRSLALLGLAIAVANCAPGSKEEAVAVRPSAEAPASAASNAPLPLPISINAVMVALVDFAADGVWRPGASETPLSDRQWLFAEQDAINLIASASLITMAGNGANDAQWVAEDDWRRWATEMQVTAEEAKAAVNAKDQPRLKLVGDRLVEICQTCHQKYKPGLPSMGITRFPIYPKRDGA